MFLQRLSNFLAKKPTNEIGRQHPIDKGLGAEAHKHSGRVILKIKAKKGWQ